MRKILLVVGAILSGLYMIGGAVQFIHVLRANDPASGNGMSLIAANIVPFCIGAAIFVSCLNALRRKKTPGNVTDRAT